LRGHPRLAHVMPHLGIRARILDATNVALLAAGITPRGRKTPPHAPDISPASPQPRPLGAISWPFGAGVWIIGQVNPADRSLTVGCGGPRSERSGSCTSYRGRPPR